MDGENYTMIVVKFQRQLRNHIKNDCVDGSCLAYARFTIYKNDKRRSYIEKIPIGRRKGPGGEKY